MSILTLRNISVAFDDPPLLDGIDLQIQPGERVGLIGRNGEGKSTLMRIIHGGMAPDGGEVIRQKDLRTALLAQDLPAGIEGHVHAVVSAHAHADPSGPPPVDTILSRMQLEANVKYRTLSVGLKRRTLLARALAASPDLLLLDEPTNHLDIDAITWLEDFLLRRRSALLFVTHDRVFMQRLATRIVEIDRGQVFNWACDYPTYLKRKEAQLGSEAVQQARFDRELAREETWVRQGIRARRTRNEGRVRALKRMREVRRNRRGGIEAVQIALQDARQTTRLVIEADDISFGYDRAPVVQRFSTTILRGDKVGLIGPNGAGKTTLMRLLLGELQPKQGIVKHGLRLQIAYFDQLRAQLDGEKTVFDSVANGSDRVRVDGKIRHVFAYLQNFLFSPERSRCLVKVLSGGERNRLLLANLFTVPANVLALDEPTNDLDAETLEVLETMLVNYTGTVLLVSHDREFLNNVVTSTIAFEGPHGVNEYVGGYDDYLRQRPDRPTEPAPSRKEKPQRKRDPSRRLSYRETRELEALPERIETLETEQRGLHQTLSDPAVYQNGARIPELTDRLKAIGGELETAYERWEALEGIRQRQE